MVDVVKDVAAPEGSASLFISAPDGLKLHLEDYGPQSAPRAAVVCLPGLSRTCADFHELALALAGDRQNPRRVLALDHRGRGASEYDRNPANYTLPVELADLIGVLDSLEISRAVFVGTSMGGVLVMLLATVRPTVIVGTVLNDIGPVIEPKGLMRIKNYVGNLPTPRSYEEGAQILRQLGALQFPHLTAEAWLQQSRLTWKQTGDRFKPTYDPGLTKALGEIDLERPLPPLWPQFNALAGTPLMLIRGANSDVLSPETVEAMRSRRSDMGFLEVADQGHAPLLSEPVLITQIGAFVLSCDTAALHQQGQVA